MTILENIQNSTAVRNYRQGYLVWLGAHKAAFELAQGGFNKLVNSREEMVEELVQKGAAMEETVQSNVKGFFGRTE